MPTAKQPDPPKPDAEITRRRNHSPIPAFKVGDWVEWGDDAQPRRVGKLIGIGTHTSVALELDDGRPEIERKWQITEFRPWSPRVGEMCEWTYDEDKTARGTIEKIEMGMTYVSIPGKVGGPLTPLSRKTLRPAHHPVESIPQDVAELLAEARKECPGIVVSATDREEDFGYLVLWDSHGFGFGLGRDGAVSSRYPKGWSRSVGSFERRELAHHFAAGNAWPREDARRMVEGSVELLTTSGESFAAFKRELQAAEEYATRALLGKSAVKPSPEPKAADPYKRRDGLTDEQIANPTAIIGRGHTCRNCGGKVNVMRQACTCCGVTAIALEAGVHPTELDRLAAKRSAVLAEISRPLRMPKHPNAAPCVLGRTERRVQFVDGKHPAGWSSVEGED